VVHLKRVSARDSLAHLIAAGRRQWQSASTKAGRWLRHPIAPTVVGFVLTGLVGCALTTWYTYWNARQERALADHKAHYDMSTRAVQEFARTAYDRYTRAEMLQSSLLRHAPLDEVKQRKRAYDAAFAEWGASHQANLLAIRKITRSASYTSLEHSVDMKLVPILREVDTCLTAAYHQRLAGHQTVRATLQRCGSVRKLQRSLDCSHAITGALFEVAATSASGPEDQTLKEIELRCGQSR
jgi:hypothetical protein